MVSLPPMLPVDALDRCPDDGLRRAEAACIAAFRIHHGRLCAEVEAAQQQAQKNARDHGSPLGGSSKPCPK